MDRLAAAKLGMNLPGQVDQLRIDLDGRVLPPVPEQPVDPLHRIGLVLAVALVDDAQGFFCMDVVKGNRALVLALGMNRPKGQLTGGNAAGAESQSSCNKSQVCPIALTPTAQNSPPLSAFLYRA